MTRGFSLKARWGQGPQILISLAIRAHHVLQNFHDSQNVESLDKGLVLPTWGRLIPPLMVDGAYDNQRP